MYIFMNILLFTFEEQTKKRDSVQRRQRFQGIDGAYTGKRQVIIRRLQVHMYTNSWVSLFRRHQPLSSIRPTDFREVLPLEKKPVRNATVFAYTILGVKSYLKSGAIFNSVFCDRKFDLKFFVYSRNSSRGQRTLPISFLSRLLVENV